MARAEEHSWPEDANMSVLQELLQYFQSEASASGIDHQFFLDTHTMPGSSYVSCVKFAGVPILPPLMTEKRQEEMSMHKRHAVLVETRVRAKARQKLLARVQNVMTGIDERHRANSRLDGAQSAMSDNDSKAQSLSSPSLEPEASGGSQAQDCETTETAPATATEIEKVPEIDQVPGGLVPPLDLQDISQLNAAADSGISSRPVTAATVQESLHDACLDTMADVTDLSSEEKEDDDNTLPKDGWSPRSADSGLSKGEVELSISVVEAKSDARSPLDSSDDKTQPVTVKEQIQTVKETAQTLASEQRTTSGALTGTQSQSTGRETSSSDTYLQTVIDRAPGGRAPPVGLACLTSTNSSAATASSGTTASSEEMNRTVISREEAACYQTWSQVNSHTVMEPQSNQTEPDQTDVHPRSDQTDVQPKWALLSKVAFNPDGDTPDSTPSDSTPDATEADRADTDEASTVAPLPEHDSQPEPESEGSSSARVQLSPGPTSTPDVSTISHVTSEGPVEVVIESATTTQSTSNKDIIVSPPQPGLALGTQSFTTMSDMYTQSTDLAPYMVGSMDTIQSSLSTLPHSHTHNVSNTLCDVQQITLSSQHSASDQSRSNSKDKSETTSTSHNTSQQSSSSQPTPSSGKKGHVRNSSYTLLQPSPVLVAAQAKAQDQHQTNIMAAVANNPSKDTTPSSVFQLTSSMEDLKLKPVQRKLHYEDSKQDHSGGVVSEGETASITEAAKLRNPKKKILGSESESTSESEAGRLKARVESEKEGKQEHLHRYLQHVSEANVAHSSKENTPEHQDNERGAGAVDSWLQGQVDPLTLVKQNPQLLQYLTDEELLQLQMHHFEQLQQQLLVQQQQQLTHLMMEQQKQQQLFQREILEQERHLQSSRNKVRKQKHRTSVSDSHESSARAFNSTQGSHAVPLSQTASGLPNPTAADVAAMINGTQNAFDLSLLSSVSQGVNTAHPHLQPQGLHSDDIRPVSAPTPHVHFAPSVEFANGNKSPAGPAGVYYDASFPGGQAQQGYVPGSMEGATDLYQSPAALRSRSAFTRIQPRQQQVDATASSGRATETKPSPRRQDQAEQKYSVLDQNLPPEIHKKFEKVTATARGFLTRRLMQTDRVQHLIQTIKDTAQFAINFHQESPIKKGVYSTQDKVLQQRVLAQLDAAMYEIHEIFFEMSIRERMSVISQSRASERERLYKAQALKNANNKQKRLSGATLKAMERKRKMKAAEEAVFGEVRPKSAPPPHTSCSPGNTSRHSDISGPIKRNYQFLMSRALKPTQAQASPNKPVKETLNRATAKQKDSSKTTVKTTSKTTVKATGTAKMSRKTAPRHNTGPALTRKVAGKTTAPRHEVK